MLGFRVCKREAAASTEWVARFAALPVANISDSMSRMSAAGPDLRPYHAGGVLCGPALTVRTRPGDNLMVHKALDMAAAGDVVVVDAGGDLTNALIGELMSSHAKARGIAGIVINGAIRDRDAIGRDEFPVFAAGVTHRGPYKDGPGEINVPISLGGMVIAPGDLIVGDADGLVSVPIAALESVYVAALAKHQAETRQLEDIAQGRNKRDWVDKALAERGCVIEV